MSKSVFMLLFLTSGLVLSACSTQTEEERAVAIQAVQERTAARRTPESIAKLRPVIQECVDAVVRNEPPAPDVGAEIGVTYQTPRSMKWCNIHIPNSGPDVQFAGNLIESIADTNGFSKLEAHRRGRGALVFSNGSQELVFSSTLNAGPRGFTTLYVQYF